MPALLAPRQPVPERTLCPGAYVTDGIRLFRVAAVLVDPWKGGHNVHLEDAESLETTTHSSHELRLMGLRLVRGPA